MKVVAGVSVEVATASDVLAEWSVVVLKVVAGVAIDFATKLLGTGLDPFTEVEETSEEVTDDPRPCSI